MVQVYSEPIKRRYYASWFSQAFVFNFVLLVGSIFLSLCIAFTTGGFWDKYKSSIEQPTTSFSWNAAVVLQGSGAGQETVWTTSDTLNECFLEKLAAGSIQVAQLDHNNDLKADTYLIKIVMRGSPPVYGAKVMLEFVYHTKHTLRMHMTGLAYIEHSASVPGCSLAVNGELQMLQSRPLLEHSVRTVYKRSLLNFTKFRMDSAVPIQDALQFDKIMAVYSQRNETTFLTKTSAVWLPSAGEDEFVVSARIQVPAHQVILYKAMRLELLKFGWIQFLAIFAIIWWLARHFRWFVYKYQVVESRIKSDLQPNVQRF